jgi:hypothetical protein
MLISGSADSEITFWNVANVDSKTSQGIRSVFGEEIEVSKKKTSLFREFSKIVGKSGFDLIYHLIKFSETKEEAENMCWQVSMEGKEEENCPVCCRVELNRNNCFFIPICKNKYRSNELHSWNLLPTCKSCSIQLPFYNLIDQMSVHPGNP